MPGPHAADYKVEIVTASGAPDMQVSIVGDQVVSLVGSSPGDVLVVAGDGQTLITAPSATPGAHAATHAAAGPDPVTLTIAQTTGLQTALDAKVAAALYDANSILIANVDDTPAALVVAASTVVGRRAAGGIAAISYANLLTDLGAAPLASPALTGNPTAPTQSAGDNSTKLATTAYANALVADAINDATTGIAPSQNAVFDALALKAPLASPALTGSPTTPTQAANDNSTKIASTAYVDAKVVDSIADADTTHAPSRNAVFDALALKAPLASPSFTGSVNLANNAPLTWLDSGAVARTIVNVTAANLVTLGPPNNDMGAVNTEIHASSTGQVVIKTNQVERAHFDTSGLTLATTRGIVMDNANITTDTTNGTSLAAATNQKTGMHGARVVQRAGAAQVAVATTGSALASFGYTQAQADAIVALLNEVRATLVEKGIMKGAA